MHLPYQVYANWSKSFKKKIYSPYPHNQLKFIRIKTIYLLFTKLIIIICKN